MNIYIDNKNIETYFGISVLDYSEILGFAGERENERTWFDKSGVDKNLVNVRYDSKEFTFTCIVKQANEILAYNKVNTLIEYMFTKGCFIISLRDVTFGIRECYLCERSQNIVPTIHIRPQNGLYYFKIGFKDVNPNAIKYYTTVVGLSANINYTKGQYANVYWGDGSRGTVSNSNTYSKNDYTQNGLIDIVVDLDKTADLVTKLIANFTANQTNGIKPFTVEFTDLSTGDIKIWSWDFGDGYTSSEQNPTHIYETAGVFTVTLQLFNAVNGNSEMKKVDYITVRNAQILINNTDFSLINDTDYLLKN